MTLRTADICDQHGDRLHVAEPIFTRYGAAAAFSGEMATLKVFEDNSLVRELLAEQGRGRVLVVDSGGSLRCALLGDRLGELAVSNGWSGVVVNGCVRDTAALAGLPIGILALAAHPMRSTKRGAGERDVPLRFAGVSFIPGQWLYADEDGFVVSEQRLK